MNNYYRMAVLAQLNEDLKEFNPDYNKTKNLIRHNTIQMLKTEKDEPRNQMLRVFKLAEKEAIKDYQKSTLVDRRWLSDGSLECVYRAPDGTIRVDVVQENTSEDYQYEGNREKSKARDEKIKKEQRAVEKTFSEFGAYFTGSRKTQENKKLLELYS